MQLKLFLSYNHAVSAKQPKREFMVGDKIRVNEPRGVKSVSSSGRRSIEMRPERTVGYFKLAAHIAEGE